MNGNGARETIVRDVGVDDVENAVDRLIAAGAQDRGAQDLSGLCIDSDLHQSLRFAFLDGATHFGHRALPDQELAAGRSRLLLRHADTSERRVDVERVTDHALAHAAVFAVQEIRRDDLVVVIGSMGKRTATVAVAERPDARDVRRQAVVHFDVTARIHGDAGLVESQIAGVGLTADSKQYVRSRNLWLAFRTGDADQHTTFVRRNGDALGARANGDAFFDQNLSDRLRDVFVLLARKPRAFLDDGDLGAETAIHLGELEADVASADDNQMLGDTIERDHRRVREV